MKEWLRRETPDLFLAAVVALVIMVAVHTLDGVEDQRINADARTLASDGLTIDERINVLDDSIRRSTMLYLPVLAGFGGIAVGLGVYAAMTSSISAFLIFRLPASGCFSFTTSKRCRTGSASASVALAAR